MVKPHCRTWDVDTFEPTSQWTNPWKFREKILRIGRFGKWVFFSRPFWFFNKKKVFFQWKQPCVSYEVSFFSKFWWLLLFSSQNKLSNYFAHDFSSLFWIKLHPRTHSCSRTYFHMSVCQKARPPTSQKFQPSTNLSTKYNFTQLCNFNCRAVLSWNNGRRSEFLHCIAFSSL